MRYGKNVSSQFPRESGSERREFALAVARFAPANTIPELFAAPVEIAREHNAVTDENREVLGSSGIYVTPNGGEIVRMAFAALADPDWQLDASNSVCERATAHHSCETFCCAYDQNIHAILNVTREASERVLSQDCVPHEALHAYSKAPLLVRPLGTVDAPTSKILDD
jgi:hypothetical protein